MKKNLLPNLEYNAIPNSINKINTDTEDRKDSFHAKVMGLKYFFLCFLSALFFWVAPAVTATTFTQGCITYEITSADTVKVFDHTGDLPASVIIPATVTEGGINYTVTMIGANAFQGCTGLSQVLFLGDLPSAGDYVFNECSNLPQDKDGKYKVYYVDGKKNWTPGGWWEGDDYHNEGVKTYPNTERIRRE